MTDSSPLSDPIPNLSALQPPEDLFKKKKEYKKALAHWQQRLLHLQQVYYQSGKRVVLVFEGVDAAGKGGAIRRLTEPLDPRGFKVHAIGAPTAEEQGIHYLYRFFNRLPRKGKIAIFDRSWYGRVLVERVEAFATDEQWGRAYREINEFERWLVDDGVLVLKFYLQIDREEQTRRFEERLNNPYKFWKLTEEDIRNRQQWGSYVEAANEMFARTSTTYAPWFVLDSRHKWSTRVQILKMVVEAMDREVDLTPLAPDPEVIKAARKTLGIEFDPDNVIPAEED